MQATTLTAQHDLDTASTAEPADAICELCGSSEHDLVFTGPDRLMGYDGTFSFVRCRRCGLLYQWPRLPWEQLERYYEGDYSSYAPPLHEEPSPIWRAIKRLGVIKQRRYIERFRRSGRLLDVGCGTGSFLTEMQTSGQWQLSGLEPTHVAAAKVRERTGIPVIDQPFESADLPAASQDVITLWHVLEHVASPTVTLDKAWDTLAPGGLLILSVPNYESLSRLIFGRFWVGWDLPRHLYVFPRALLRRTLARHGFQVIDHSCFLISYASLGHTLDFWTESWPAPLQGLGKVIRRIYYTPLTRLALYPLQLLVERLGVATVTTWTAQKVAKDAGT